MAGNLKRKIDEVCPLCSGTVKSYQLSFEDSFVMCSQVTCPYPFEEEKQADGVNSSTTDIRYAKSNDSLLSVSNTVDHETVDSDNKDRPKKKSKYTSKPCSSKPSSPKSRSPKARSPKARSPKPRSPASVNNVNSHKTASYDSVPDTTLHTPVDTLVSPTLDDLTLDSLLGSFYTPMDTLNSSAPRSSASVNNVNNHKTAAYDSVPDTTMYTPADTLASPTLDAATLDSLLESFNTPMNIPNSSETDGFLLADSLTHSYDTPLDTLTSPATDSTIITSDDILLDDILSSVLNSKNNTDSKPTLPDWLALPPVSASINKKLN